MESLKGHPFAQVIVADDGEDSAISRALYSEFESKLPLKVLRLPHDVGLSAGRNEMVKHTNTEYFLLLDDDQGIPGTILHLHQILLLNEHIGGISGYWNEYGKLRCDACDIQLDSGFMILDIKKRKPPERANDLTYFQYDFIPNSTLFRTQCLVQHPWDDNIKIGTEHIDFYLNQYHSSNWTFAVTPDVVIDHFPRESSENYQSNFRRNQERLREASRYFNRKWKIQNVIHGKRHLPNPWLSGRVRDNTSHLMVKLGFKPHRVSRIERKLHEYLNRVTGASKK